jgi:hypothetical protein
VRRLDLGAEWYAAEAASGAPLRSRRRYDSVNLKALGRSPEVENPNAYDDEAYLEGVTDLSDAILHLWAYGASLENLRDEIANAIENATDDKILVEIRPAIA